MSKPTVTGSFLARLFSADVFKFFSENASTEQFNAAETEAARIQAQIEASATPPAAETTTPPTGQATVPPTAEPTATVTPEQLTAMTTRATDAEGKVTALENQLKSVEADRDKYKAWHDKQSAGGTRLPGSDAANRNQPEAVEMSSATADALAMFQKRKAQA